VIGRPLAACLLALTALSFAAGVRANDFDQFQNARVAYESLNYELSADLFEGLLADAAPGDKRPLISESRKYLAASYLFLGRKADAEAQLVLLLHAESGYVLDPLAFPEDVGKLFAEIKARLALEQQHNEQERQLAAQREQQANASTDARQRQRMQRLLELASTERVEQVRSRWIAAVPFGVGQFQNDHDGLGIVLAAAEGTLLATSVVAFGVHESLRGQTPTEGDRAAAREAESASRYTNQLSLAAFAAVALVGVLDAELRFKPSRSFDRPRRLAPDISDLSVSIAPLAVALGAQF
jgi:hypothetical protein